MPGDEVKHVHVIVQKLDLPFGDLEFVGAVIDITEQKRGEDELRRSEAYLAQAQTLTLTCSFRWKTSTGELYWSQENYWLLGYDQTIKPSLELIMDRCHPEDRAFLRETLDRAVRFGEDIDFKHRLLLPDGTSSTSTLWPKISDSIRRTLSFWELGGYYGTAPTQIALEAALAQVQKSEDQLRTIIDTIPSLAWSTPEDGCADFLNKRWLDYTGLSMEEGARAGLGYRNPSRRYRNALRSVGQDAGFEKSWRSRGANEKPRWQVSMVFVSRRTLDRRRRKGFSLVWDEYRYRRSQTNRD